MKGFSRIKSFSDYYIVMDKKAQFNEALTSLVDYAATKGNEITQEDVKVFFKDLIDDESQYGFINDYLSLNKIKVLGFTPTSFFDTLNEATTESIAEDSPNEGISEKASNFKESQEEIAFVNMYMSDMENIEPLSDTEKVELINQLLSGNAEASKRLVEGSLSLVAEIAGNFRGKGVSFGDLIQEGNIGMMLAVSDYNSNCGDFNEFITNRVTDAIKNTINEQINSDRISQHLADQLNLLDKVTKQLSEKLGRVPELAELSEAMGIDEDEVSLLLKTSINTLSVNQDTKIAEDTSQTGNTSDLNDNDNNQPLTWRHSK